VQANAEMVDFATKTQRLEGCRMYDVGMCMGLGRALIKSRIGVVWEEIRRRLGITQVYVGAIMKLQTLACPVIYMIDD